MARLATVGALSAALVVLVALQARSETDPVKVPDPRFSQVTPVLVGCSSGQSVTTHCEGGFGSTSGFQIVLRGVNNEPLVGKLVGITFDAPGVRLYSEQESGCTMDCTLHLLEKVTDLSGVAVFHPRFGGSCNTATAEVWGEGVVLKDVPVRSTDMDAEGGTTGLGDFGRFAPLFLAGSTNHPEADFDGSGGPIGLADFNIFAREYLLHVQGAYCP